MDVVVSVAGACLLPLVPNAGARLGCSGRVGGAGLYTSLTFPTLFLLLLQGHPSHRGSKPWTAGSQSQPVSLASSHHE